MLFLFVWFHYAGNFFFVAFSVFFLERVTFVCDDVWISFIVEGNEKGERKVLLFQWSVPSP